MANSIIFLYLSLCFYLLFNGCFAHHSMWRGQFGECQLDRLDALEPTNRIEAEAGVIESWDPNHEQFQCAGVAVSRVTIEPNGLLPSYSNAPTLIYIVRGRGFQGTIIPGCPETYQESQQRRGSQFKDKHQKIQHFREGEIHAVPAGAAHWWYNHGDGPIVAIVFFDTSNFANQLDQFPRRFFLAGNPEEEFPQRGEKKGSTQKYRYGRGGRRDLNNIFSGFDQRFLAEVLNVGTDTLRRLRAIDDYRGSIVKVERRLDVVRPPYLREEEQEESESRRYDARDNGFEETICSLSLKTNIGDPSRADIYSPEAGRITTVNSHNLPILKILQLSAERGALYRNGIYVPHWNMNAHIVIYVTSGRARVQVVDDKGQSVFDGELREGQLLTVPQNYALMKRAGEEGFRWVSFKTKDDAMVSPLVGRNSAMRALPLEVVANAYRISREEARRLKFNRKETTLFSASGSSSPWTPVA